MHKEEAHPLAPALAFDLFFSVKRVTRNVVKE